jgi:osmotically inducible protein OsmC
MPRIERSATAAWAGSVARGSGRLSSPSLVLHDAPFSLTGRTAAEASEETSPEELLAAAHAACFAMALSARLTHRDAPPDRLTVTSTVALDQVADFNRIVAGELTVEVVTSPLADDELEAALGEADERCPFSALLRDAGATVTVALTSHVTS